MARTKPNPLNPNLPARRTGPIGFDRHLRQKSPDNFRLIFNSGSVSVQAWPSRGGVIVLEHATAVDFRFVGLGNLNLQVDRDPDQEAEDGLCQLLLLLGAKWFDSLERRVFAAQINEEDEEAWAAAEAGEVEPLTKRERRWVSVGWEEARASAAAGAGGLWVVQYDMPMFGGHDLKNRVPETASRVPLASTMEEKCAILKLMPGARYFSSLKEYDGEAYLRAWQADPGGEHGTREQTRYEAGLVY